MLKIPTHQVAGHQAGDGRLGPLVDETGRFYKPLQGDERGSNELKFYKAFTSNTKIPHIRRFFPTFYGSEQIEASDGSGLRPHLVLQDLALGRVNPSIIDIKMGSRTWAPQSTEEYIQKCLKKDRETSSLPLGFRLSGLQIYRNEESGYWKPEKRSSIQNLSANEVKLILKKFVSSNASPDLNTQPDCAYAATVYGGSGGILSQLLELKAWFEDQTIYHFYSCSILMMFEKRLASEALNPGAIIKLIDFAHVIEGGGVIDHNFLGGVCSLIKFISEILTAPNECTTEEVPSEA